MNQAIQTPSTPQLTKAAQDLLSEVQLLQGENIHYAIQGDGFFMGSNPIAKAVAAMQAALVTMTGGHIRILVVITNLRVLLLQSQQAFCGFRRLRGVNAIALASIAEAGSGKDTQWCCIHTRTVHIQSKTQRYTLVIKKLKDDALRDFVRNMSEIVVTNVHNRLAT
ncbi:MAG: hypothetical protein R3A79_03735 [Nannocystaceae bacterium]